NDVDFGPKDFATDEPPIIQGVLGKDVCGALGKECVGLVIGDDATCAGGEIFGAFESCYSDLGSSVGGGFAKWDCEDTCPDGTDDPAHTGGCINVDECTLRTDQCSDHAECEDNDVSYSCCCLPGFVGDG